MLGDSLLFYINLDLRVTLARACPFEHGTLIIVQYFHMDEAGFHLYLALVYLGQYFVDIAHWFLFLR